MTTFCIKDKVVSARMTDELRPLFMLANGEYVDNPTVWSKVIAMSTKLQRTPHGVNVLNEKPLHAALKEWYVQPNNQLEVSFDGFVVDVVCGGLLVEIQTRNFAAMKKKLDKLMVHHRTRLVYPIPRKKWIVKLAETGTGHVPTSVATGSGATAVPSTDRHRYT